MPGHLIRRAQQIAVAIFIDECARQGLTPVQYASLAEIARQPGIDATDLAGRTALDRSTLGTVLDKLERKGLIQRNVSPRDRRSKVLTITAAGATLLAAAEPNVRATQQKILAPLSENEAATFISLLTKLVTLNNEASRAPVGNRRAAAQAANE